MKNFTVLSVIALFSLSLQAQTPHYDVRGVYQRSVTEHVLHNAKTMGDLLPGYPASWIDSYTSSELALTDRGKTLKATGLNDTLTTEQRRLLKTAGLCSELRIRIRYSGKVFVTNAVEHNTLETAMTVIPETEAAYPGGDKALIGYIKEHSPFESTKPDPKNTQQVLIRFTVNEKGKACHAKLLRGSGNKATDKHFLKLLRKMPAWKPAEHKGRRVVQDFELSAGNGGGC